MTQKISLFLMTQKGFFALAKLLEQFSPDLIESVIGCKDPAVTNDFYAEIKQLCTQHKIQFFDRKDAFSINSSAYCFAIGWRFMINISTPLIVFHDSLLPQYRGFNPLVSCLINHEKEIGVTALLASAEYDCGDVLAQRQVHISYPIKIQLAIDLICPLYFEILASLVAQIIQNQALVATPQKHQDATYSVWRDDLDYKIDWHQDAYTIQRMIDAVGTPYSGAYALITNQKAIILDAVVVEDVKIINRTPGKVIFLHAGLPVVICGQGLLKIVAMEDEQKNSLLPLKPFRLRFQ